MEEKLLYGKNVARDKKEELIDRVKELKKKGITPKLGIMRIGENPDDIYYERAASKRMDMIGAEVEIKTYPLDIKEDDFIEAIEEVNVDDSIHGVLIFMPLPKHISEERVKDTLDPKKDVDGITPMNGAHLFLGKERMVPCTAKGVVELLKYYEIPLEGANVTIIGRSPVVGKPASMLLLNENATVTITHSRTKNLPNICRNADILIAALGKTEFVTKEFVRPESVVIDVGINENEEGKMVGDVKFDEVSEIVKAISPVPGGVGSVTTTLLAEQLVDACERSLR